MFQSGRYEINCNFTKRSISISIKLKLSNVVTLTDDDGNNAGNF